MQKFIVYAQMVEGSKSKLHLDSSNPHGPQYMTHLSYFHQNAFKFSNKLGHIRSYVVWRCIDNQLSFLSICSTVLSILHYGRCSLLFCPHLKSP